MIYKAIKGIMLTINLVVFFIMALTLIGTVVSPESTVFLTYTALIFPITIFLNIAFVIFWIFARKWYFIISLIILLAGFPQIKDTIPFHINNVENEEGKKPLKILSYNTTLCGELKKHTSKNPNAVIQYILDSDADVVCLQEFAVSPKIKHLTHLDISWIFRKYPYKHIWYKQKKSWAKFGVATFSKYPIINKEDIHFESKSNASIYTDIVVNDDTIRVINNHLESNKLTERDRDMPVQLTENFDRESFSGTTLHLSRKLGAAYKIRAQQADSIAGVIKESPYKVIVCGDFNDVPASYTYTKIKGDLKDAFSETGFGFGWTLNLSIYRFRIDYILCDQAITPADFKIKKVKYSDHYPIHCNLYLN